MVLDAVPVFLVFKERLVFYHESPMSVNFPDPMFVLVKGNESTRKAFFTYKPQAGKLGYESIRRNAESELQRGIHVCLVSRIFAGRVRLKPAPPFGEWLNSFTRVQGMYVCFRRRSEDTDRILTFNA